MKKPVLIVIVIALFAIVGAIVYMIVKSNKDTNVITSSTVKTGIGNVFSNLPASAVSSLLTSIF